MSDHELTVTIDSGGWTSSEVRCSNAGDDAACRNMPECDCESWDIERDDEGWFHVTGAEYEVIVGEVVPVIHRHSKPSDCNVCEWLNADDPLECLVHSAKAIPVVTIPIKPVWSGDYYEWEPIEAAKP